MGASEILQAEAYFAFALASDGIGNVANKRCETSVKCARLIVIKLQTARGACVMRNSNGR